MVAVRVQDKAVSDRDVFTDTSLSANMSFTREGFLLCKNVRIGRIGIQDYLNEELVTGADDDMEPGANGIIRVERTEDEVFKPEALASFEGKCVVDDHPDDDVTPDTYKLHSVGTVLHPRRGEGDDSDYVIADLLIKDKAAIEAVRAGKREVSCGYDAEYRSLGPGRAQQYDIFGNHVALVDRGRCGRKCSIGDREMKTRDKAKSSTGVRAVLDSIMKMAAGTKDEAAIKEGLEFVKGELNGTDTPAPPADGSAPLEVATAPAIHIHLPGAAQANGKPDGTVDEDPAVLPDVSVDPMEGRLAAIEATLQKLLEFIAPKDETVDPVVDENAQNGEELADGSVPGADNLDEMPDDLKDNDDKGGKKTGDKNRVKDSAPYAETFRSVISDAEIIAPGLKHPTFDRAADPKKTVDGMCLIKRRALAAASRTNDGAEALEAMTGKRTLDGAMPCSELGVVFNGVVALTKDRNSLIDKNAPRGLFGRKSNDSATKPINNPHDFNNAMRAHYNQPTR